ncbi:hypothetical protein J8Z24_07515 [Pseudoalteromonas sp. SCSIO 43201]|uniref:DUF6058 family natural product biosynthesis protein n=1 Tax=Pseudoalteromonas sp. SCSIO 43201 TaxID=2822842 RepID=UPI0020750B77|nr:DUF6058 family natural product biosynthesis protein [Pseudoalteromonas sp. SCSIO 43201]USD29909.1 hypothetical protein J8Z24_07515 [Pseudoalteromonas sp. SCSIO 43201]
MELIHYLQSYFITKEHLLRESRLSQTELNELIEKRLMPKAAYRLALNLKCDSFFGAHCDNSNLEFYPQGALVWLGVVSQLRDEAQAFDVFSHRYKGQINRLKTQGFTTKNTKLNGNIDSHLSSEWQYFLDGIYGLCTKTGLPEDIANKEAAIIIINEYLALEHDLSKTELVKLHQAINLLDDASTQFAPHEREQSSRKRLIENVRAKFPAPSEL